MKSILEAIVRTHNAEMQLPYISELGQASGYQLRASKNLAKALLDMMTLELQQVRGNSTIAQINPLTRDARSHEFDSLLEAVTRAAGARRFGAQVENVRYQWQCIREDDQSHAVASTDVFPGQPAIHGQSDGDRNAAGFQGYCSFHAIYESVHLVEIPAEAEPEEEEDTGWRPSADQRFRIAQMPNWFHDYAFNDYGWDLAPGLEGRILWTETIHHPTSGPQPAWMVQLDNFGEIIIPVSIMGAPRDH